MVAMLLLFLCFMATLRIEILRYDGFTDNATSYRTADVVL
jgi:hypothetical protein